MSEHAGEPIRGLPGHLPAGEHILWQGSPDWRTLSRSALKAHWVAVYFGGLAVWNVASQSSAARPAASSGSDGRRRPAQISASASRALS